LRVSTKLFTANLDSQTTEASLNAEADGHLKACDFLATGPVAAARCARAERPFDGQTLALKAGADRRSLVSGTVVGK
jgi:hypothetical protein